MSGSIIERGGSSERPPAQVGAGFGFTTFSGRFVSRHATATHKATIPTKMRMGGACFMGHRKNTRAPLEDLQRPQLRGPIPDAPPPSARAQADRAPELRRPRPIPRARESDLPACTEARGAARESCPTTSDIRKKEMSLERKSVG